MTLVWSFGDLKQRCFHTIQRVDQNWILIPNIIVENALNISHPSGIEGILSIVNLLKVDDIEAP